MVNLLKHAVHAVSRCYQRLRSLDRSQSSTSQTPWELLPFDFRVDWYKVDECRVVLGDGEFEHLLKLDTLMPSRKCPHCGALRFPTE